MELSPQFNVVSDEHKVIQGSLEGSVARRSPKPRTINISPGVRASRGASTSSEVATQGERLNDMRSHGLITDEEHRVMSENDMGSPLHPKNGSVIKGSVIQGEIAR